MTEIENCAPGHGSERPLAGGSKSWTVVITADTCNASSVDKSSKLRLHLSWVKGLALPWRSISVGFAISQISLLKEGLTCLQVVQLHLQWLARARALDTTIHVCTLQFGAIGSIPLVVAPIFSLSEASLILSSKLEEKVECSERNRELDKLHIHLRFEILHSTCQHQLCFCPYVPAPALSLSVASFLVASALIALLAALSCAWSW